jgi:SAM-dependent methyltransferase
MSATNCDTVSACPACGTSGGRSFWASPDRLHNRKQTYTLARCETCSLAWLVNRPALSELPYHYGASYHEGIAASTKSDERFRVHRERLAQYKRGGALLDIGCNSGAFLSSMENNAWHLYGIEINRASAELAKKVSNACIFVGEILDAKFAPSSIDAITALHVLEHHYEPRRLFSKCYEWLKPGGILYVVVPNIDSLEAWLFRSYWYGLEMPRHVLHFTPYSLRLLGSSKGFEVLRIYTGTECFIEGSVRYIIDDMLRACGLVRTAVTEDHHKVSFPIKVIRRLCRDSILLMFRKSASILGKGATVTAIFRKP